MEKPGACIPKSSMAVHIFKFQKRLDEELDVNETIQETLFIPPQKLIQRKHLLRNVLHIPGDLLVITSSRVLWITDRERTGESRELYGTIVRYAPIDKIGRISSEIQKLQVKLVR